MLDFVRVWQRLRIKLQRSFERERRLRSLMEYLDVDGLPLEKEPNCPRCDTNSVWIADATHAFCRSCGWKLLKEQPKRKGEIRCWLSWHGNSFYYVVADGPWEAVFHVCSRTGISPEQLVCRDKFRMPNHEYCVELLSSKEAVR